MAPITFDTLGLSEPRATFLPPAALLPDLGESPRPAPTEPPSRRFDPNATTRLLELGVLAGDVERGVAFPSGPPIATALADAFREHGPAVASARFVARVASDGRVVSLEPLGEAPSWAKTVAAVAAQSLNARGSLSIVLRGALRHGALATVEIASTVELPSGADRRGRLPRRKVPAAEPGRWPFSPDPHAPRLSRKEEGHVSPLPPDLPGPPPRAHLPPRSACTTGRGDIADLGAHPVRRLRSAISVVPAPREE